MKKIFLFTLALYTVISASAQLKIDLVVGGTPPAQLSEWGNRREVLMLIVTSQPGLPGTFKIKTQIQTSDGTVIGSTDLARANTYTVTSGASVYTSVEVLPLEFMVFTGKYQSSLQRSGKLPSDNYNICVQLVRPVDYSPASEIKCKPFYLASLQLPILMKPASDEVLSATAAQTAITFRWTPLVPRPTLPVTYRLQVYEILPGQKPLQALRRNQPLLEKDIVGTTQYIWQPRMVFTANSGDTAGSRSFIWTVQTLDSKGLPVSQTDGNGESRSEPVIFQIADTKKLKAPPPSKTNNTKN